jgi:hypothetical protein
MVIDCWNGNPVRDPESYLRSELGDEPLPIVSKVLGETFTRGFSAAVSQDGVDGIGERLANSLGNALAEENLIRPITPGFRDMLLHLPESHPARVGLADAVTAAEDGDLPTVAKEAAAAHQYASGERDAEGLAPASRGARANRTALESALGSGILDYYNGYPVGDLRLRFISSGGTDTSIIDAIYDTFGPSFETTMRDRAAPGSQISLGERFGDALRRSLRAKGVARFSDVDFGDLNPKFGRRELRERDGRGGGQDVSASESPEDSR